MSSTVLGEIANRNDPTVGTTGPCIGQSIVVTDGFETASTLSVGTSAGPDLTPTSAGPDLTPTVTSAAPGSALGFLSSFVPIVLGSVVVHMTTG